MFKISSFKIKLSLLSVFFTPLLAGTAVVAIAPSVGEFAQHNRDFYSTLFLTIPSLAIIPFLVVSPFISSIISKRKIVLAGLLLYAIGGIGCLLSFHIYMMLFFRIITGIGAGCVIPHTGALICDYFKGKERENLISYSGVIIYSVGIFLLLSSSWLVNIHWRLGFLIFLISLVPFYLILHNLTEIDVAKRQKKYPFIFTISFKKIVWITFILYLFSTTILFSYFINVSFLMLENGLGKPQNIAYIQSVFMFFCIVSNVVMSFLDKKNLRLYLSGIFLVVAIGFIVISFAYFSIIPIYIGSAIVGLGYGSFGNMIISIVAKYTNYLNRVNALSFSTGMMYLGQFFSPIVTTKFMNIFELRSYNEGFFLEGFIIIGISIILILSYIKKILKQKYRTTK